MYISRLFRKLNGPRFQFATRNISQNNAAVPSPKKINTDMIGPSDPVSNLRRIVFKQPHDETDLEKVYRQKRLAVQEWNQVFWTKHNTSFFQVCNFFPLRFLEPCYQSQATFF